MGYCKSSHAVFKADGVFYSSLLRETSLESHLSSLDSRVSPMECFLNTFQRLRIQTGIQMERSVNSLEA